MGLISPVITGLQGCGSEYAVNSKLILQSGHILYDCLQSIEGVKVIKRGVLC